MPDKFYPNKNNELLGMLSPADFETIKREYPYKNLRDKKIREIMQKGVSCYLLAEITGLSKSSINRIGQTGFNLKSLTVDEQAMKNDLAKVAAAVDAFHKEMKKILHRRRK